ncbi:MAG TPA: penicillin acylase family protein [Candidatus Tumulicola sp.]|nr:penicillin acylase family protein [Candidatus Tumulicola sp.]
MRTLFRVAAALVLMAAAVGALFAINVALGMRAHARYAGTISGLRMLHAPVSILRDDRGVPHIVARDQHDLFFAQGYAEGSDRLFQMDLLRRFVEGDLAEVLGRAALSSDERERAVPVRAIVQAQWRSLDAGSKETLGAFGEGVNAAIDREPLPVEFRILAYRPAPWTPEDSLAVSMATVLDLIDDWNDVEPRDSVYRRGGLRALRARYPLSDPCYDAPLTAGLGGIGPGRACGLRAALLRELDGARVPVGSNEWAAGANRSLTGRALLANDPHLALRMPGVWYLADLRAPGFHAAGATFPGAPGIVLGHDERVAWGATDGTVASLSVFEPPARLDSQGWQTERFRVRFGGTVTRRYYRDATTFGVTTKGGKFVLVRWGAYLHPISPATTFLNLDRAATIEDAEKALAAFPGPTHNFAIADTSGRAAYVLAGPVPDDPVWARWFHPAGDLAKRYGTIPFEKLPKVAASRDAVVWTSNNKMYASGYPWRLSPQFAAPYRAYRVAQLLRARAKYDVAYFAAMQMDVLSIPERELAHELAPALRAVDPGSADALAHWDGEMDGDSSAATLAEELRLQVTHREKDAMPATLEIARRSPAALALTPLPPADRWASAGAVTPLHAFASLGIAFLDGSSLPGDGDAFTLHVQYTGYSQSFRAVWDVGNWDAGGITLPQGESGEPGSGHYTDEAGAWIAGRLWPLPFSDAAVGRTAVDRETLAP